MSRTYRRRGQSHEYYWVLRDWDATVPFGPRVLFDRHSRGGRLAIARFHSDAEETTRSAAPHWYRRSFDHRLRTANDREYRRWLTDPDYDPVMQARHLHCANWSWW